MVFSFFDLGSFPLWFFTGTCFYRFTEAEAHLHLFNRNHLDLLENKQEVFVISPGLLRHFGKRQNLHFSSSHFPSEVPFSIDLHLRWFSPRSAALFDRSVVLPELQVR